MNTNTEKAAWRVAQWCQEVGVCRATANNLIAASMIESVRVGGMRLITTSPRAFLTAMAAERSDLSITQRAKTAKAAKSAAKVVPPEDHHEETGGRPRGRPRIVREPVAAEA